MNIFKTDTFCYSNINKHMRTNMFICINFNTYKIITRSMLTSIKKGTLSMKLAEETFIVFSNHFRTLFYNDLHKDSLVIKFFIDLIKQEDYFCNRAFQLALNVSYSKRFFNKNDIKLHFEQLMFNNVHGINSDIDESTLFTALQSKIVKELYPNWDIIVNETPPSNISWKEFSPKLKNILEENKTMTGNRFPDIAINGIPYDYKFSKDIYNLKNQIYMMPESPQALKQFSVYIFNLQKIVSNDAKLSKDFRHQMLLKINIIYNELQKTSNTAMFYDIVTDWNNFLIKNAHQRPTNFGVSMFVITKRPYITENFQETSNIPLIDGTLDHVQAKAALDAIIGNYPLRLQQNIFQATKGMLGHIYNNFDIHDIHSL